MHVGVTRALHSGMRIMEWLQPDCRSIHPPSHTAVLQTTVMLPSCTLCTHIHTHSPCAPLSPRPSPSCLCTCALAVSRPLLHSMAPADTADAAWALARWRAPPSSEWAAELAKVVDARLPEYGARELAIMVWATTRLGLRPGRAWLLRFRAACDAEFGGGDGSGSGSSASELAQYVASLLGAQNRGRFRAPAPSVSRLKGAGRLPRADR